MKPIYIYLKEGSNKIELTKEELEKMLDQAYSEGYNDGSKNYITIGGGGGDPIPLKVPKIGDSPWSPRIGDDPGWYNKDGVTIQSIPATSSENMNSHIMYTDDGHHISGTAFKKKETGK